MVAVETIRQIGEADDAASTMGRVSATAVGSSVRLTGRAPEGGPAPPPERPLTPSNDVAAARASRGGPWRCLPLKGAKYRGFSASAISSWMQGIGRQQMGRAVDAHLVRIW
jgi:hypothetical protein